MYIDRATLAALYRLDFQKEDVMSDDDFKIL